jgi:hypothetical protein
MLDMRSGRASFTVLSFGGFMGIGEKLLAVPWEALRLDTANKRFVLDVNKDRLQSATGFHRTAASNFYLASGGCSESKISGGREAIRHRDRVRADLRQPS